MNAAPVYDQLHGGHARATVGFDVVRTTRGPDGLLVEVIAITAGEDSYLDALTQAKAQRNGTSYGYPSARYSCGCRWIATAICGDVEFRDLYLTVA